MYGTWSVPKGGNEGNVFVIRLEYGLQPYKEEMHSKGSGSMKMNDEEIKKYTEAISKNSDNLFVCPRCETHTDKLKANIKTHLKRKNPCMHSSSSSVVHQNVQVTNDHSTHTSNHDHSVHNTHTTTINNANITIQLQPINCSNPEWEDLVNNNCIKTIEKRLGCSLSDAAAALLACLKLQHLNADLPQRHNVCIRDGDLEKYRFADDKRRKNAAWRPVPMDAGLKDLICRRRLDFVDVQASLERKLSSKRWRLLEAGLDDLENLSNDGKSDKEDMNATFDKLMHDCEAAIAGFCRPLVNQRGIACTVLG